MTEGKSRGTKLTLMFCSCDSNALGAVIVPILAVLAVAFPGENINLLVSIPPLLIIPTSLIVGKLAYYVSRKTLLTIGQVLYIIGGIGAAWFTTFEPILVMRVILGIGCGIVYPIVPTLIAQLYKGHERSQMLGRANAVGGVIAMGMSMLAGMLATIGWHLPFYVDLFFILVLIMQLMFLPKMPPEKDMPELMKARFAAKEAGQTVRINPRAWLCALVMFAAFTLGMIFLTDVSVLIATEGLGDSVSAGFASSFATGTSVLMSFTFPFVYKRLKRWTLLLPLLAAAVGFAVFSSATTITAAYIASIVYGCYLGYLIPYCQNTVSSLVHPLKRTFAMSVLTSALFAGEAFAAYFIVLVQAVLGESVRALFAFSSVGFIVMAAASCLYLVVSRRTAPQEYRYVNIDDSDDLSIVSSGEDDPVLTS
jgi:MFS family permease